LQLTFRARHHVACSDSIPMPSSCPEGWTRGLWRVSGCVERARGLKRHAFGSSHPYVVVKGIKPTSSLVELFRTEPAKMHGGGSCKWEAHWTYDCYKNRTREEFVGLKFMVFDGEDFLGGCDYDVSLIPTMQTLHDEIELAGLVLPILPKGAKPPKKARIFISLEVQRELMSIFPHPQKMLRDSLSHYTRVSSICCTIVRAKGLKGYALPMCFVRCIMVSGRIVNLHNTKCHRNSARPEWADTFAFDFEGDGDTPLLLMFDILGGVPGEVEGPLAIWAAGDHLGSGMLAVAAIQEENVFAKGQSRLKIPLVRDEGMYERRLRWDGAPVDAAACKHPKHNTLLTARSALPSLASLANVVYSPSSKKAGEEEESSKSCYITVEAFVERDREVPMPYVGLLEETEEIHDLEDNTDEEIQALFLAGERNLRLGSKQRIMAVYGALQGASDLITSNLHGKTCPYLVVQAISRSGNMYFAYRTRIAKNTLYPEWNESFVFLAPLDPDDENPRIPTALVGLQMTVYDSHHSTAEGGDHEDPILGRCSIDLTFMRSCDCFKEAVPLLGVQQRAGGAVSKGEYKRYSSISVELRVERRVNRILMTGLGRSDDFLDVHKHNASRPKMNELPSYRDISQDEIVIRPAEYDVAEKLLEIRDANVLLENARRHATRMMADQGWLAARQTIARSLPQLPLAPHLRRKKPEELQLSEDESPLVCPRRSWLPLLKDSWSGTLERSRNDDHDLEHVVSSPNTLGPRRLGKGNPAGFTTRFGDARYEQLSKDPFLPSGGKQKVVLPRFGPAESAQHSFNLRPRQPRIGGKPKL